MATRKNQMSTPSALKTIERNRAAMIQMIAPDAEIAALRQSGAEETAQFAERQNASIRADLKLPANYGA
jgi:hypothetical protein